MGRLEDEIFLLRHLATTRMAAIDAGANQGYYSYCLSKIFTNVVAFEPNGHIIGALVRYDARNIRVHNIALSSSRGSLTLYIPVVGGVEYPGWASVDSDNLPGCEVFKVFEVESRPLDDFRLSDVSLMKIDVEGHEMEVLQGGRETIQRNRPVILIEIKCKNRARAARFLEDLEYLPYVACGRHLHPLEESLSHYQGSRETFIFKPV